MSMNTTTPHLIVKGSRGFIFEFKWSVNKQYIAFIRYRDGDREFARTCYIFTGLFGVEEWPTMISRELDTYTGSTKLVKKRVIEFAQERAKELGLV